MDHALFDGSDDCAKPVLSKVTRNIQAILQHGDDALLRHAFNLHLFRSTTRTRDCRDRAELAHTRLGAPCYLRR